MQKIEKDAEAAEAAKINQIIIIIGITSQQSKQTAPQQKKWQGQIGIRFIKLSHLCKNLKN